MEVREHGRAAVGAIGLKARAQRAALLRASALTAPALAMTALLSVAPAYAGGSGGNSAGLSLGGGNGGDGSATNAFGALGGFGGGGNAPGSLATGLGGGGGNNPILSTGVGGAGAPAPIGGQGGAAGRIFQGFLLTVVSPLSGAAGVVSGAGGSGGGGAGLVIRSAFANISTLSGGIVTGGAGAVGLAGGGGGGGDGVASAASNVQLTIGAAVNGGFGGLTTTAGGGAGGGGAGVAFSNGGAVTVNAAVTGGQGGISVMPPPFSGHGGGGGGAGIAMPGGGTVMINAEVRGGAGGNGDPGGGGGGAGVIGANLDVRVSGTGSIAGGSAGLSRSPTTYGAAGNAVTFTGGLNALELRPGARITGKAVGKGGDTLRLGGAGAASFDVSQVVSLPFGTQQYLGFGLLRKVGSSSWTLTGSNALAPLVFVDAGKLAVDGWIGLTPVFIASGATLSGVGAVGAVTANAGSTLAPGSGVAGTSMSIASLSMAAGSTYAVDVSPSAASFAQVAGVATIGGAGVVATFVKGGYVAKRYTILSAGTVSGTFAGVSNVNLPQGFTTTLSYDPRNAYLDLSLYVAPPTPSGPVPPPAANPTGVAGALQTSFDANGGIPSIYGSLDVILLLLASGQTQGAVQTGAQQSMNHFVDLTTQQTYFAQILADHASLAQSAASGLGQSAAYAPTLASADAARAIAGAARTPVWRSRWEVWAQGYGGVRTIDRDAGLGAASVTDRGGGFALGLNYKAQPDLTIGMVAAVGASSFALGSGVGSGHAGIGQIGVSALKSFGASYLGATGAYGFGATHTSRLTPVGGIVTGDFNTQSFQARAETGHRFALGAVGATPYAAITLAAVRTPSYVEKSGAGANPFALRYSGKTQQDAFSELGLRLDHASVVGGGVLGVWAKAGWRHDFRRGSTYLASFAALPNATFLGRGASQAADAATLGAGAKMQWTNGYALAADVDASVARNSRSLNGKLTLSYAW